MKDFSFQGKVYLGTRLAGGKPGALIDVGDAPDCKITLSVDSESRKESRSGKRLESAKLITGQTRRARADAQLLQRREPGHGPVRLEEGPSPAAP